MAWQVEYLAHDGVVAVTAFGPVSVDDLTAIGVAGIAAAREHSVKTILLDAQQMTITAPATQIYGLPGLLQEQGLTRAHKVAIVFAGDPESKENFLFLETIFFNRGFPVRLFAEMARAMAWLKRTTRPSSAKVRSTSES